MMDTTKEYIKMCKKATKIQEYKRKESHWTQEDFYHESGAGLMPNWIWLPRQDQLQDMLPENHIARMSVFIQTVMSKAGLGHYVSHPDYNQFTSMEQIWLAFVMKEKYNKIWDGNKEEWVAI